ncbi:hypothetical protein [Paraburkholderia youngii]|uniref:hypothetical protein n=1 Tax=Paraburkholderia youngii TaxID=2782701 RepID=UPI003D1AEAEC
MLIFLPVLAQGDPGLRNKTLDAFPSGSPLPCQFRVAVLVCGYPVFHKPDRVWGESVYRLLIGALFGEDRMFGKLFSGIEIV